MLFLDIKYYRIVKCKVICVFIFFVLRYTERRGGDYIYEVWLF